MRLAAARQPSGVVCATAASGLPPQPRSGRSSGDDRSISGSSGDGRSISGSSHGDSSSSGDGRSISGSSHGDSSSSDDGRSISGSSHGDSGSSGDGRSISGSSGDGLLLASECVQLEATGAALQGLGGEGAGAA